jgi:TonB family protein
MLRELVLLPAVATIACATVTPAMLQPGYMYRSHKLLSVESDVVVARMPEQGNCPGWDRIDSYTERLGNQEVRVVSQFTVTRAGSVDSVQVVQSNYAPINEAVVEYIKSCTYRPATTAAGERVAVRVEWPLTISFGRRT